MNVQKTIEQLNLAVKCYRINLSARTDGEIDYIEQRMWRYAGAVRGYIDNTLKIGGNEFDLSVIDCKERHAVEKFLKSNNIHNMVGKDSFREIKDDLLMLVALENMVNDLIETYGESVK